MSQFELFGVDAFTKRAFAGNPAAVVTLDDADWPDEAWMQSVAFEMNLAETAFVRRRTEAGVGSEADGTSDAPADADADADGASGAHADGTSSADAAFALRWFTPGAEVDLCGHATVATAHVLWASGRLPRHQVATFATRSGLLTATPRPGEEIELDFPALPPSPEPAPAGLVEALGVDPAVVRSVLRSRFDLLVELDRAASVAALAPDFRALRAVEARGTIVTARADAGDDVDVVSRFFAPAVGVDEDPVTGSAHCVLAPYWAAALGRTTLQARQISRRGGLLRIELRGDRVGIAGHAVTVYQGRLTL